MRQPYWEFRGLGVEFVALGNDTPEDIKNLRERLDLPFTLLSDPEAEIARQYDVFHENEPKGRNIARVSVFYVDSAENGAVVRWEHVSPSHHHRVPPSRLSEVIQEIQGRRRRIVSVLVPSEETTFFEDKSRQLYASEITMGAYTEIHRLTEAGYTLSSVTPEYHGGCFVGQRHVFTLTT